MHFAFLLLVAGCANQVALTGGPRDQEPPRLDSTLSFANEQVRFLKQPVELFFDEYVEIRDPVKQIVVSPPLQFPLLTEARLRKITVSFAEEEELKEDVTYIINFGESIQDFTEANKLKNFTLVFSTGDYIDSLTLSGQVKDAFTGLPSEDVLVMLYDRFEDSIVYKEKPFYFARTDKSGTFQINNIRLDTFKIFGLLDKNINYLYDPGSESIAFIDSLMFLSDTTSSEVTLQLFKEISPPAYQSYEVIHQGKIQLEFSEVGSTAKVRVLDDITHFVEENEDTPLKYIWYMPRDLRSVPFATNRNTGVDTISARVNTRTTDTLKNNLRLINTNQDRQIGLNTQDSLTLFFDRPVMEVDLSRISLIFQVADGGGRGIDTSSLSQQDTLPLEQLDTFSIQLINTVLPDIKLRLHADWTEGKKYVLTFLPGALIDFFGRANDTLVTIITVARPEDFGSLNLQFSQIDSVQTYVLQLMKEDKVLKTIQIDSSIVEHVWPRLVPGTYELRIIEDENKNARWDPGNYLAKKQSERLTKLSLEPIRAGWKGEKVIDFKEIFNTTKPKDDTQNEGAQ